VSNRQATTGTDTRPLVVTGAGGFVGGAVVAAFAGARPVLALARQAVTVPGAESIAADLTAGIPPAPNFRGAVVVHAAAAMGTQDRGILWAANVDATRRVADWAVAHQAAHLIFISSGGVYPYERGRYWKEDDPVRPIGYYGHTKHLAEELLRAYDALDGLPVTVFRLFFPFGPGQTRGVAPFVSKAVRDGTELTIQGPGEPRMNPVHVSDCVDAVRRVVSMGPGFRVYNLCGDRTVSFLDLVHAAEIEHGRKARTKTVPTGPGDLLGANDLLKNDTGWTPRHPIPAG
jgi:nucleoside-diphosphate-sugar epimerase